VEEPILKHGMILRDVMIRQSDKSPKDALAFHGRMAIIVKGVELKKDEKRRVNIVVEDIKKTYAFARIL